MRIKHALVETSVASTSALVTFLATIYRYSPDALAHVHRVAATSLCIGDKLALPTGQLRHIERAALAHDLGKLVVNDPDADEDRGAEVDAARRAREVIAARDVLMAAPFLRPAAQIVGALAERVDGRGQPDGLSGDAIPVGARIVSVADAFDALTSLAVELVLSPEVIAAELVKRAGTRFDPTVVAACLRWMDHAPLGVAPEHWLGERTV